MGRITGYALSENMVKKGVKQRLEYWETIGMVVHWDRLNSGKIKIVNRYIQLCKAGTPDFVAYVKHNGMCYVVFIETKKPSTSDLRDKQIEYYMKFQSLDNVYYQIANNPRVVDDIIEKITNNSRDKVNSIEM